jgi:hypothetical protein
VSHRRANSADVPSHTKIPVSGLTAKIGNLATGVEYQATVVGTCADGTKTPPSAPVRFTPAIVYAKDVAGTPVAPTDGCPIDTPISVYLTWGGRCARSVRGVMMCSFEG